VGYLIISVISEGYVQLDCVIYGLEGNLYNLTDLLSIHLPERTEKDHEDLKKVIILDRDSKQRSLEYKHRGLLLCHFDLVSVTVSMTPYTSRPIKQVHLMFRYSHSFQVWSLHFISEMCYKF
jgi:hypothetical protein